MWVEWEFVVLAPTGTAAALLHGSTYHSFFGVPIDGQTAFRNVTTNNAQVKTRLDGVEYTFLDEVSMVACNDNYKISSQLAKALNEFDLPSDHLFTVVLWAPNCCHI